MRLALHEPLFDREDEEAVVRTLRDAWVSTGGPEVDEFEGRFADFVGSKHAVSVANGTVGLSLMLESLARIQAIERPFVVVVPTLSFIATANAVVHAGGIPVFFDSLEGGLNGGPEQIQRVLNDDFDRRGKHWILKGTGVPLLAVMPAHIMGWLGEVSGIVDLCRFHEIPLVEDAAESLGAFEHSGRHVGSAGLASVFSFNGNKILTTGGGGMVVTNDSGLAGRLRHLSTTAKVDVLRFVHDEVGYNYRMVNILAALGLSQLKKLPSRLGRKSEIFQSYKALLAGCSRVRVYEESSCRSNNWLVNLVFDEHAEREAALHALNKKGIQSRPLWTPSHLQPAHRAFVRDESRFPNSTDLWLRTLSVPSSPQLSADDVAFVCSVVRESLTSANCRP